MSFSSRNVSQLLVGNKSGGSAISDSSAVGDYQVIAIADPNTVIGALANKGAKLVVKTTGGIKISEFIPLNAVINSTALEVGTQKLVTVTVASSGTDPFKNKTFSITINKHDHIGSPLNDRFISAYVVTDEAGNFVDSSAALVAATADTVAAELRATLGATVAMEGKEFVITGAGAEVIITEVAAKQVVGVSDGINLPWEVEGGVKSSGISFDFFDEVFAQVTVDGKIDGLTQLKNIEWFNSGYDKDPYRETGYPYSFGADSNIVAAGVTTTEAYGIFQFYKDRDATNVERQHRQLIVVGTAAAALKTALEATTV